MQETMRFVRSGSQPTPRIIADGQFMLLATFLETDLQDPATGQEMLDALQGAFQNKLENFEMNGNAYTISLDGDHVAISSLFDESHPGLTLPATLFIDCIKGWVEFQTRKNILILKPH